MNIAIILISGLGTRLENNIPKQYIMVNNKPIFSYCLETFNKHNMINQIVLVAKPEWFDFINNYLNEQNMKNITLVEGGNSRNDSLRNAYKYIKNNFNQLKPTDIILTHDGVRPLVSSKIITDNIEMSINNNQSIINTAIKCNDSIYKSNDNLELQEYIERKEIFLSQTPQSSNFEIFEKIYSNQYDQNLFDTSDYCTLGLINNIKVKMVNGSNLNFKITNIDDLELFKKII